MNNTSLIIYLPFIVDQLLACLIHPLVSVTNTYLLLVINGWISGLLGMLIWLVDHGILAVILSVALFWWVNIRYGKLIIEFPLDCDIHVTKAGIVDGNFEITFLLYNSGTPDIIVRDCRMTIKQDKKSETFWCKNVAKEGDPIPIPRKAFMVVIQGRKGYALRFLFENPSTPSFFLRKGNCVTILEFKLQHHCHGWVRHISRAEVFGRYPMQTGGERETLGLHFMDQKTAIGKVPEVREGRLE